MHVCKCVYTSVCVCTLTKLFNLSQSLTVEWLWRLSFEGDITLRILCECVTASIVLVKHSLCACYTYVGNYASEKPVGRM